jgi:hypothetical protein
MAQVYAWKPFAGSDAFWLAGALLVIASLLAFFGTRLRQHAGVSRPGKAVGGFLVIIWFLSPATFAVAVGTYIQAWMLKYGDVISPPSPIAPVTALSGVGAFIAIAILTRRRGWKAMIASAAVGALAGAMIFELPFDLIVMGRTFPPDPATLFRLLFFLPLFLVEISSFSLLTLSPALRLSRWTLFALAGMVFVFAIWALFGFAYPSDAVHFALNAVSKVLSFVAAVTLFLPALPQPGASGAQV